MKKKILILTMAAMLFGIRSYAYDCITNPQEKNPLDNELFEIVAEVDSDFEVYDFDTVDIEYSEDRESAMIWHTKVEYDGSVSRKKLSDYVSTEEAYALFDEHSEPEPEYGEDNYAPYNDGLAEQSYLNRVSPYIYKDINGNLYAFYDNMWPGWGCGYNLGLMKESQRDFTWEDGMNVFGDDNTNFYTIFSDDIDFSFPKTTISVFDDNGYALMQYDGKQYVIKLRKAFIPTVFYNGEKIGFDQIPVIENGRTLVPLRAIFEKIGAVIEWDEETQTVTATKDDTTVSLTINSTTATKNGKSITLDVPAKIISNRTLVPVRFVSDCFGVDVEWNDAMQQVILTSK